MTTLIDQFTRYRQRADDAINRRLPPIKEDSGDLEEAMHYAVMNGGKRVRPILVYATGEALGASLDSLDASACAIECLHAYSLVHDDLPAMDDDDLRRGNPTCHIKYGEATAILAGDALQTLAFSLLLEDPSLTVNDAQRLKILRELATGSGCEGMVYGQAVDLSAVGKALSLQQLEWMHRHKTGALIRSSVRMGALSAHCEDSTILNRLDQYANAIGLAFQVVDDILDITADTETLGKQQGADIALNKPTYPALLGLDGARKHAESLREEALDSLASLPNSFDILRSLANYIVERSY